MYGSLGSRSESCTIFFGIFDALHVMRTVQVRYCCNVLYESLAIGLVGSREDNTVGCRCCMWFASQPSFFGSHHEYRNKIVTGLLVGWQYSTFVTAAASNKRGSRNEKLGPKVTNFLLVAAAAKAKAVRQAVQQHSLPAGTGSTEETDYTRA